MKIDAKTKYSAFAAFEPYLTDESVQTLKKAAEREYGDCYNLTLDEFWAVVNEDYSRLGEIDEPTVLQVYWLKRFSEFVEEFSRACETTTLRQTADEKQANAGTVKIEPMEAMLIFTRSYFGLPSFFEAGKRTIGEYLTARKDSYNTSRVQRNMAEIQRRKYTKK